MKNIFVKMSCILSLVSLLTAFVISPGATNRQPQDNGKLSLDPVEGVQEFEAILDQYLGRISVEENAEETLLGYRYYKLRLIKSVFDPIEKLEKLAASGNEGQFKMESPDLLKNYLMKIKKVDEAYLENPQAIFDLAIEAQKKWETLFGDAFIKRYRGTIGLSTWAGSLVGLGAAYFVHGQKVGRYFSALRSIYALASGASGYTMAHVYLTKRLYDETLPPPPAFLMNLDSMEGLSIKQSKDDVAKEVTTLFAFLAAYPVANMAIKTALARITTKRGLTKVAKKPTRLLKLRSVAYDLVLGFTLFKGIDWVVEAVQPAQLKHEMNKSFASVAKISNEQERIEVAHDFVFDITRYYQYCTYLDLFALNEFQQGSLSGVKISKTQSQYAQKIWRNNLSSNSEARRFEEIMEAYQAIQVFLYEADAGQSIAIQPLRLKDAIEAIKREHLAGAHDPERFALLKLRELDARIVKEFTNNRPQNLGLLLIWAGAEARQNSLAGAMELHAMAEDYQGLVEKKRKELGL